MKNIADLDQLGFEIVRAVLNASECDELAEELSSLHIRRQESSKGGTGGVRDLLKISKSVSRLVQSKRLQTLLREKTSEPVLPNRALFFDKTPDANRFVPWHQDLVVPMARQTDNCNLAKWTVKDGVPHAELSTEMLGQLLSVRIHLDDCDRDNGALKVMCGSHRAGKLSGAAIAQRARNEDAYVCEVKKGDALLMRPLLIHSSSASKRPSHRRVIDIQFATRYIRDLLEL